MVTQTHSPSLVPKAQRGASCPPLPPPPPPEGDAALQRWPRLTSPGHCFASEAAGRLRAACSSPLAHQRAAPPILPVTACHCGDPSGGAGGAGGRWSAIPAASTTRAHGCQQSQDKHSCSCHSGSSTIPAPKLLAPLTAVALVALEPLPAHGWGENSIPPIPGLGPTWQLRYHPADVTCILQNPWNSIKKYSWSSEDTEEEE